MGHVKVVRRNITLEEWSKYVFGLFEKILIEDSFLLENWQVREGEYFPEGYKWFNDFRDIKEGERWGGPDATAFFKTSVKIPERMKSCDVYFHMITPCEVIVSCNNKMVAGLDPNRNKFVLSKGQNLSEELSITMEAYTRSKPDDDRNPLAAHLRGCVQSFSTPQLIIINEYIQSLLYDLHVLHNAAFGANIDDNTKDFLQSKIKNLLKLIPGENASKEELLVSSVRVKAFFEKEIYICDTYNKSQVKLACVAHSHLDIAYFWRVKQTHQKNARTALIQLNLMDDYPEFRYAHSQAWTYESLEQWYPDLFEKVKKRIQEGRWEIVGGMYVEPDCNVTSAESLIRQLLYGKLYFQEKFGVDVKNCWLPDVFGNSAILPQILKKSGVDYFVSNKMSTWNDTNKFPYEHFLWEGIDGTQIPACVPPVHFITWMDPDQAAEHWNAVQDKVNVQESLQMYGFGDGGSGATQEMIEYFHRQNSLPGIPKQRLTTASDFLNSNFVNSQDLPVWKGDLYLEMHRGTFTNKGILKNFNRRAEISLKELESLSVLHGIEHRNNHAQKIKKIWKRVLLNQFHDILPGTHVKPVTEDCLEDYLWIFESIDELRDEILNDLTNKWHNENVIYNPHFHDYNGLIYSILPLHGVTTQKVYTVDGREFHAAHVNQVSPLALCDLSDHYTETNSLNVVGGNAYKIYSPWYEVKFFQNGQIEYIYDKTFQRYINKTEEVLDDWQLFEDTPGRYSAWDILDNFEDKPVYCGRWNEPTLIEDGPFTIAVKRERTFGHSKAVQIIRLYRDKNIVEFECFVDWHEREKLLKVAFPCNVNASTYSCDNSAGSTKYVNHRNTSWQQARYEVPCHKWVDISEGLYGVSIMNDSKYGVDVKQGQIRMSLLRSSVRPDNYSDQGLHKFKYALTTHGGSWQSSDLQTLSEELNKDLIVINNRRTKSDLEIVRVNPVNRINLLAIKNAEDQSGDIVIRLSEYTGTSFNLKINLNFGFKKVYLANMLEEIEYEIKHNGFEIDYLIKAHEILTLRVVK